MVSSTLQTLFQQALALHQSGRLVEAKAAYQELLRQAPDDPDLLRLLGMAESRLGNATEGMRLLERSLQINPNQPAGYNNYGLLLLNRNRAQEAIEKFERALALNPDYAVAHNNLGNALTALRRLDQAVASYDRALALEPNYAEAHYNRGIALQDLRCFDEALASLDRALALEPNAAEVLINRGIALQQLQRLDEALASYDRAIALRPDYAEAYGNRGNALRDLEQYDAALECYGQAIALKPDYAEAYNNRGNVLAKQERFDDALVSYERAIALKPDYAEAYNNRGNVLAKQKRFDDALASYEQAIALKPDYAEAHKNRGISLVYLKRFDAALASYKKAIALKPDNAEIYYLLGNAFMKSRQYDAALANYEQAIALKPDNAEVYYIRGNALLELKQYDAALASYEQAIDLNSDYAEAYNNKGVVLNEKKQYEAALASYEQAFNLNPDIDYLLGSMLYTRMQICDWSRLDVELSRLIEKISQGEKVANSFIVMALTADPAIQRKAAEIFASDGYPEQTVLGAIPLRKGGKKIRIGYFSADFRNHPVSILLAELFELHDRSRFELFGFSFGPDDNSELRKRVKKSFMKFFELGEKSDKEVAELARKMEIDVAVDLGGFTTDNRAVGCFSYQAAPVQLSYIGYLGTMGAPYFDYLIADKTIIPQQSLPYYSEKIAYLPSYQVNDSKRRISDRMFTREELGLPATGFVFCCFNNNYKLNPETFDGWMRILRKVPESVLLLYAGNDLVKRNLRKEAERRGVNPGRLVFSGWLPTPEYLARYRAADLFLDTLPYNAGTTASDALWAGLPVLTQTGESFASRVAASLLKAIGLPELITNSQESYEALAIELATHPDKLGRIRQKLQENRLTAPLFDTPLFTRHIEAAYAAMNERYLAGLAPEHIYIEN